MPPTQLFRNMFGDTFFYILYFQTPGVAEHELRRDVRRTMRDFLFAASGDRPADEAIFRTQSKRAAFLDQMPSCEKLPDWLSDADLDFFVGEFERTGFHSRQLLT